MTHDDPDGATGAWYHERRYRVAALLTMLVVGVLAGATVANLTDETTGTYDIGAGVHLNAGNGPEVRLDTAIQINRKYPVTADRVNLLPLGYLTGDSGTFAGVAALDDTWTTLADLDVDGGQLTAVPANKPEVRVQGGATTLEWRDYAVGDGSRDLYLETSGSTSLTLTGLGGETAVALADANGDILSISGISNGEATFTTSTSGDLYLQAAESTIDNPSPTDGAFVDNQTTVDLSVSVDHPGFDVGNTVTVTFYDASDDSQIGQDSLTTSGTATTTWSDALMGTNRWYVVADDGSVSVASSTWSFDTPSELELVNEETLETINTTDTPVDVTFFAEEEIITRSATNGTVSLDGLPHGELMIVRTDPDGFYPRETVIRDITSQSSMYLLNESSDAVDITFTLDDPANEFSEDTLVLVERALNVGANNTTQWTNIVGTEFGLTGALATLQPDVRYRVVVEEANGDNRRRLGSFTPTISEEVVLQISERSIEAEPVEDEAFRWNAVYDERDQGDRILVDYNDTEQETSELRVLIHERGNESRQLANETFTSLGSLEATYPVDDSLASNVTAWRVTLEGTLESGGTFTVDRVVNPGLGISLGLPDWLRTFFAMGVTVVVGGLLGGIRAEMGAIVVAVMSGVFWLVGWLPGAVSGGVIALALFVAIAYRVFIYGRGVPSP